MTVFANKTSISQRPQVRWDLRGQIIEYIMILIQTLPLQLEA